jgi:hypothetical protein
MLSRIHMQVATWSADRAVKNTTAMVSKGADWLNYMMTEPPSRPAPDARTS